MAGNTQPLTILADQAGFVAAEAILADNGLVAVPTETVYGLAARADSDEAVAAIYRAKGRPDFNPLIVHVRDLAAAECLAQFDERAKMLAAALWPGPLTLVLPRRPGSGLAGAVSAGLPTVAIRCPAHPAMLALLKLCAFPLAAPSANRSGAVSPTTAAHVAWSLGERVDLILDGGPCQAGLESTIVALRANGGWSLLRPGPIAQSRISALLGRDCDVKPSSWSLEAPGQMASHYAPGKPVRLDAAIAMADEFHIGFGPNVGHFNLSPTSDVAQAASLLYAALHAGAASDLPCIAVAPIPNDGIGAAIRDRLIRAAA